MFFLPPNGIEIRRTRALPGMLLLQVQLQYQIAPLLRRATTHVACSEGYAAFRIELLCPRCVLTDIAGQRPSSVSISRICSAFNGPNCIAVAFSST